MTLPKLTPENIEIVAKENVLNRAEELSGDYITALAGLASFVAALQIDNDGATLHRLVRFTDGLMDEILTKRERTN
jgi:hypothetical protein